MLGTINNMTSSLSEISSSGFTPKIGFTGVFAERNFGDYAMLLNNIIDIGLKDISIFTYDAEFNEKIIKRYLPEFKSKIIQVDVDYNEIIDDKFLVEFSNYLNNENEKIIVKLNNYPEIPLEILSKIINIKELKSEISSLDKLVVVGGGYFNRSWNTNIRRHKLLSIFASLIIASDLGKDIIFMGNTFGPFDECSDFFKNIFHYINRTGKCIFAARDDLYSIPNLKSIGLDGKFNVIPDDLLCLNPRIIRNTKDIISGNYCIIEICIPLKEVKEKLDSIRSFVREIKDKYGLNTIFLPLEGGYGGAYQGELIKDYVGGIELYELDSEQQFLPLDDAINVIRNAQLTICNRYHLFVLSLSFGTPVINLLKNVGGDKRYTYCKGFGLLNQVLSTCEADLNDYFALTLEEAFDKALNQYSDIKNSQTNNYINFIKTKIDDLYKKRKNYIECNILS